VNWHTDSGAVLRWRITTAAAVHPTRDAGYKLARTARQYNPPLFNRMEISQSLSQRCIAGVWVMARITMQHIR
jgi:hypothetical protein